MKLIPKMPSFILILIIIILFISGSNATTIDLPKGLLSIRDSAFEGDISLDEVIIHEGTQSIGNLAFANSSVKKISLPESLNYIAENAFENVNEVYVTAKEGSYAYNWAATKNNLIIEAGPVEQKIQVTAPSTLQAGADLEIQVTGTPNTVSHSVYLINTETQNVLHQTISKENGTISHSSSL